MQAMPDEDEPEEVLGRAIAVADGLELLHRGGVEVEDLGARRSAAVHGTPKLPPLGPVVPGESRQDPGGSVGGFLRRRLRERLSVRGCADEVGHALLEVRGGSQAVGGVVGGASADVVVRVVEQQLLHAARAREALDVAVRVDHSHAIRQRDAGERSKPHRKIPQSLPPRKQK